MTTNRLPGPDVAGKYGTEFVLEFVGGCAGVQFSVDTALRSELKRKMPVLGPVVADKLVSRVRDDERLPMVLALGKELNYPGDLRNFKRGLNHLVDRQHVAK